MIRLSATYTDRREDFKIPNLFNTLVKDYYEDIVSAGISTAKQLGDAVRYGRKTWKWFPKPSEIIEAHRELCKSAPRYMEISDRPQVLNLTPDEIERNKTLVALSIRAITGEISFAECEKKQNEILGKDSTI